MLIWATRPLPVISKRMWEVFVSKSILGILHSEAEAREAIGELNAAGFNGTDIEIVSGANSFDEGRVSTPPTTSGYDPQKNSNSTQSITNFFHSLVDGTNQNGQRDSTLPSYADDRSYYAEALRRGRIVLVIRARDQESADYVCKVLNRYGGDNISAETGVQGAATIPESIPPAVGNISGQSEAPEPHLTPSERTEGRVQMRGVRVYDYANAAEAPADLREPQPDSAADAQVRTAKP